MTEAGVIGGGEYLRLTPSGEIYLKTRRVRDRFVRMLIDNLRVGMSRDGIAGKARRSGYHELRIDAEDADQLRAAFDLAERTFGVDRVERVTSLEAATLPELAETIVAMTRDEVAGHTFAVRVRRGGSHDWKSKDAERLIGRLLLDDSAGVDLTTPQVTVRVYVLNTNVALVQESRRGPAGLPVGCQDRALVLLSGGIDSPVAAWMMMGRGCPVDLVHLRMKCAASDQALALGHDLSDRWGHGAAATLHQLDFELVEDRIRARVEPRFRQVILKQLMLKAAQRLGDRLGVQLLVTGDSLGQVSSQTATHIAEIDRQVQAPVLRPLVALRKEEIIDRAKAIGTYELSIRTGEVCDLSDGHPVATAASGHQLERGLARVGHDILDGVMDSWRWIPARDWLPGSPLRPAA